MEWWAADSRLCTGRSRRLNTSLVKRETIHHQRVDADTAYNWASITKTMTAIAILQLRDRGRLSLDDAAVRYVPELRQVHDEYGAIDDITIRHLLDAQRGFSQSHVAVGLRRRQGLRLAAV